MNAPLISIITVTFNAEKYLEDTINSVANQTYKNIEHIIVDGGSTDLTLQIIKKHKNKISTWISEPDKGISDAMNKGISLSTGEYIIFLHSDDYFFNNDVIKKAANHLNKNAHIYLFKVKLENDQGSSLSTNQDLGFLTNLKMGSCHQGQICSQELFQDIGTFSTDFKITMDYDLILRAYRAGYHSLSIDMVLSTMRLIGISSQSDWDSLIRRFKEEKRVHSINTQNIWHKFLYKMYWPIYILYRKIFYIIKP